MNHTDQNQGNLIDGTIIAYEPCEDGAYITVAGLNGPVIVAIDTEDLERLGGSIRQAVNNFDPDLPQTERIRITEKGIEVLQTMMSVDGHTPEPVNHMAGFSFVCEPSDILGAPIDVIVGMGNVEDVEYAYIGAGSKENGYGDVLLTREHLGKLIQTISEIYTAMGLDS